MKGAVLTFSSGLARRCLWRRVWRENLTVKRKYLQVNTGCFLVVVDDDDDDVVLGEEVLPCVELLCYHMTALGWCL